MIASWSAPLPDGNTSEELLIAIDEGRERRLLIVPALFDEANKLRRLTLQLMRRLNARSVDTFLPDLPGCNESLAPLAEQSLVSWKAGIIAAAHHVSATHILTIRAGGLIAPSSLSGWAYAPQTGAKTLRGMIRAQTIAAKESGREMSSDALGTIGREHGITLAGWSIGAQMFRELETAEMAMQSGVRTIPQDELSGAGLWLRAEPSDNWDQADNLATIIAGPDEEDE